MALFSASETSHSPLPPPLTAQSDAAAHTAVSASLSPPISPSSAVANAAAATAIPATTSGAARNKDAESAAAWTWQTTGKEFLAGSLAGAIAEVIMHPCDTLNIRMKAETKPPYKYSTGMWTAVRNIVREEGVRALYSGASCTVAAALPISGIYFASYELSKKIGMDALGPQWSSAIYLVSGGLAEAACSVMQIPVELVRSRVQLQGARAHLNLPYAYSGPMQAFKHVIRDEGFMGLYCGLRSSLLLDCAYSSLQFLFYEQLRSAGASLLGRKLKTRDNLVAGGLAGALAGALTNPLDIITCRLQTQGLPKRYSGVLDCARKIRAEEGMRAFTKGMGPRLIWVTPLTAITFAAYEAIKGMLGLDGNSDGEEDDPDDIWI